MNNPFDYILQGNQPQRNENPLSIATSVITGKLLVNSCARLTLVFVQTVLPWEDKRFLPAKMSKIWAAKIVAMPSKKAF